MKVYRIDTSDGYYDTVNEKELVKLYSKEEIQEFKDNDQTFFFETNFTVRQLNRARRLHANEDYMENFEEQYDISPDVYDILCHLYGEL